MGSSSSKKKSSSSGSSGRYILTNDTGGDDEVKKLQKEESSNDLTVDKNSITALGYGPISAAKLNSLVESGEVIEYEENGKLKYRKNTALINSGTNNLSNKFKR